MSQTGNLARETRDECAACPTIDPARAPAMASQAKRDAADLVMDVRDLDPRQVWGRLVKWGREDPPRLVAVTVALAAMVPTDTSIADLLAWTEPLQMVEGAA